MQVRSYEKFSQEDEEKLMQMVKEELENNEKRINWKPISDALNRTARECYDFYLIRKQGKLEKHEWTQEEITVLNNEVEKEGTKWAKIRDECFPTLTPNQLRNKYYHSTRMKRTESQMLEQNQLAETQSMFTIENRIGSAVELNQRIQSETNLEDFFNSATNFQFPLPSHIPEIPQISNDFQDDEGSTNYIVFDDNESFGEEL